jgi:ubiquinone/menaquinone biosynthesis C-methylase UbiE
LIKEINNLSVPTPFDNIAESYDETFTFTAVGEAQRNLVRYYLKKHVETATSLNILELNCGTGEDALWLSKFGHAVLATDISQTMIQLAKTKVSSSNESKPNFVTLDIKEIHKYKFENKFDLVFSNFGGLNCLDQNQLKKLSSSLSEILNENGKFISIVMSNRCTMESLYFMLKGRWGEVFRRKKDQSVTLKEDVLQPTYYYSPKKYESFFSGNFHKIKLKPIGLFIPPSYLNKYFSKNRSIMKILYYLDYKVFTNAVFSRIADHYYIELVKKRKIKNLN